MTTLNFIPAFDAAFHAAIANPENTFLTGGYDWSFIESDIWLDLKGQGFDVVAMESQLVEEFEFALEDYA